MQVERKGEEERVVIGMSHVTCHTSHVTRRRFMAAIMQAQACHAHALKLSRASVPPPPPLFPSAVPPAAAAAAAAAAAEDDLNVWAGVAAARDVLDM